MRRDESAKIAIIVTMMCIMVCMFSSCAVPDKQPDVENQKPDEEMSLENKTADMDILFQDYLLAYNDAKRMESPGTLGFLKLLIFHLGDKGYIAVDTGNQVDMVNHESLSEYIDRVDIGENGEIQLLCISENGNAIRFYFTAAAGKVNVIREYYVCDDGLLSLSDSEAFEAYTWEYSEAGYLFIEEYHMPGYDGATGHTAIRVLPLDETCRELNRKYILPVGYELNNMFITDWSEDDFGGLDFYDLFDRFYPLVYGVETPYHADENCGVGAVYHIPADEFENVIQAYLPIDSDGLRKYIRYNADEQYYEYRPRGLMDAEPPSYPFPEVIDYTENDDGAISLMTRAVYPDQNLAEAFRHELVIRLMEDGTYRYVSNRILPSKSNLEASWRVDRLTDEEWEYYYGSGDEKPECLSAMETVRDEYEGSKNIALDKAKAERVMDVLAKQGAPVYTAAFMVNMKNPHLFEEYIDRMKAGIAGSISLFEVTKSAGLCERKLLYDGSELYILSATAALNENREPTLTYISKNKVKKWEYTEKGWFSFEYFVPEYPDVSEVVLGNVLIRVRPLPEEYIEITEKYLMPVGYMGNNLFQSEWDAEHMEGLDYNGLFESFYVMKYGEILDAEKYQNGVPKGEFEKLMMSFLPISEDEVFKFAAYDEITSRYKWARLGCGNYSPTFFGVRFRN